MLSDVPEQSNTHAVRGIHATNDRDGNHLPDDRDESSAMKIRQSAELPVHTCGSAVLVMLLLAPLSALAQWTNVPPSKIPRTPDGKPNLSAPAPRLPDGKPDLSGVWSPTDNTYARNIAAGLKPEDVPFQPWAKALFDERKDGSHSREDPDANCLPQGVPKINAVAYPQKFIQMPGSIAIIYEAFN